MLPARSFCTKRGQVLNSGRCNTIGVLTPIPLNKSIRSFYLMSVLDGINEICNKYNTDILMSIVPESEKNPSYDYLRPYKQKKVDGIIYIGLKKISKQIIDEIKLRKLPCVVVADRPESEIFRQAPYRRCRRGHDHRRYHRAEAPILMSLSR